MIIYRAFHNVLLITNVYNKKTKGPTLMELFTATEKLKKLFLTTKDVRCVHHGWHGTHPYDIQVLATGDTAHIHTIFKFLPHTRVNMGAMIFFTAAMICAFRSARSRGRVLCVLLHEMYVAQ